MKPQTIKTPDGLTMVQERIRDDDVEVWDLDVPNLMVWIKHYSDKPCIGNSFSGWRVGLGCSPMHEHGYNSLKEALPHVREVAQQLATWHLDEAKQKYHSAFEAAKAVGLKMEVL